LEKIESDLYKDFSDKSDMEICSHTKTPIAVSIKVFNDISGINSNFKERKLLLNNI